MNNLRQIRTILYRLKRNFGTQVTLLTNLVNSINVETGKSTRTFNSKIIKRAIVLPTRQTRDFSYDLSFIAANKNFTTGGYFDTNTRIVIIDRKDLGNIVPDLNNHLEFGGEKYVIRELARTDGNIGYLLVVKALKGSL